MRRSNKDRSEEMRTRLIAAARALFADKGYAETSTPEIVKAAEVTRGALYHHFADKAALFQAVVEGEARAVAAEIEAGAIEAPTPMDGLLMGAEAYFTAMTAAGRAQLLLLDGPAVLGADEMARIDAETGGGTLKDGLAAAGASDGDLDALADMLSAAFDRAALAIANGAAPEPYIQALRQVLKGMVGR